jgi:hypothetical protein
MNSVKKIKEQAMNRGERNIAISLLANFPDDPSIIPERSLGDAQLIFEGGLLALDKNMLVTAWDMLTRAKELASEAFASFLRTDISSAKAANELLGKIEEALRDLEGMQRGR